MDHRSCARERVEQSGGLMQACVRDWIEWVCGDKDYVWDVVQTLCLVCKSWNRAIRTFPDHWVWNLPFKPRFVRRYLAAFPMTGNMSFVLSRRHSARPHEMELFSFVPNAKRDVCIYISLRDTWQTLRRGRRKDAADSNPVEAASKDAKRWVVAAHHAAPGQVIRSHEWGVVTRFTGIRRTDLVIFFPVDTENPE